MAIYYIDPFATVHGTGTWASPWMLSNPTRTALVSGDEIRIVGRTLTQLLTTTTYTATVVNETTLLLTAGGNLGSDWLGAGDIGYLPEFDTFFTITGSNGNNLSVNSILPINDSSITTVTLRRFNRTAQTFQTFSSAYLGGSNPAVSNIVISDCWTSETTRVIDGSVKTLICPWTQTSASIYLDTSTRNTSSACSNWTVNLQNTHILGAINSTSMTMNWWIFADNSSYNIKQIYYNSASPAGFIGSSNYPCVNSTLNLTHLQNAGLSTCYAEGFTGTIDNFYSNNFSNGILSSGALVNSINYNLTFNYIGAAVVGNAYLISMSSWNKGTISLNGIFDSWTTSGIYVVILGGYGELALNFATNYSIKTTKRTVTQTVITRGYSAASSFGASSKMYIPTINLPSGVSATEPYNLSGFSLGSAGSMPQNSNLTSTLEFNLPAPIPVISRLPSPTPRSTNFLFTHRDGSEPKELLGIIIPTRSTVNTSSSVPQVTTDASVYKTVGPSLESYLTTYSATAWKWGTATSRSIAIKNIKIPVTAGTSYTVSGWIRTDDTVYLTGDCRMAIIHNNAELVGQDMTTACINAWEQFTLTFTAPQTCEMNLAWEMYYSNGDKSYWLDDLTIS